MMKTRKHGPRLFSTIFFIGLAGSTFCMAFAFEFSAAQRPKQVSGIYPHLTMYNNHGECGTGAVVPWAGHLWAITYAPHMPRGSSDKLYEITPELVQIIRPESIGGTPANRMIHRESNQLFIGPYAINEQGGVRAIPYGQMPGRHTGTARHLADPVNKLYYATMEEGLYSVNVHTLEVIEHIKDGNGQPAVGDGIPSKLPGYHGKGLYTGQGRLVYANNGERGRAAQADPTVPSGALAEWYGEGDWQLVRRNQFTEVTGPGDIFGNSLDTDPVWSMGWDVRSVILMLLEGGEWRAYRLPKASHSYDGAHGWNTEWPRIRDIGETDRLATMHGTFWRFPKSFSIQNSAGIAPRSNYLKVIGDFARWEDRIVFGCDDAAKKEFLNHRPLKSATSSPRKSNSNLWFVEPIQLDHFGPSIGRGSVWLHDDLKTGDVSDPYLFSGYDHRMMVIRHGNREPVNFILEIDRQGNGAWVPFKSFEVDQSLIHLFDESDEGSWIRVRVDADVSQAVVHFNYRNRDPRGTQNAAIFEGVTRVDEAPVSKGVIRSNGQVLSMLDFKGYYELNDKLELSPGKAEDGPALVAEAAQPEATTIRLDAASVIVEEDGRIYRIPKNPAYSDSELKSSLDVLEGLLPQNLAVGAIATASSVYQHYVAANAVDGKINENSRWIAADSQQLTIDLGEEKAFRAVYVASGWNRDVKYVISDFDVQIKQDGGWVTLSNGEIRGNTQLVAAILPGSEIRARELRLLTKDSGFNRIYEVAVFAEEQESLAIEVDHARIAREVVTERDLFNFHGTFYELPARNAQGFAKIRPIATHNLQIHDFASQFGLVCMTGWNGATGERIIKSSDGKTGLWVGAVDDLWQLGKPRGEGGVWKDTDVKAGEPSDSYLMTAYDRKSVTIASSEAADILLEVDIDGTEVWVPYKTFAVKAGETLAYHFPEGFSAYWVRAVSSVDTIASVLFKYE